MTYNNRIDLGIFLNLNKPNEKLKNTDFISNNCGISEAFKHFIKEKLSDGLRPRTIKEHKMHIQYFQDFLFREKQHIKEVRQIKLEDLKDYKTFMLNKNVWNQNLKRYEQKTLEPTTVNTRIRTLKSLLLHWFKCKLLPCNYSSDITLVDTNDKIRSFSKENIQRLLAQLGTLHQESKFSDFRNLVIIQVLLDTGARINQLLSVETENINLQRKTILLSADYSKKKKDHVVHINLHTVRYITALIEYNKTHGLNTGFLFNSCTGTKYSACSFRKALKKYATRAGIPSISPHMFRHYFALDFIREGGDLSTLATLLDHTRLSTTKRYTIADQDEIKAAHSRYVKPIFQL